LTQRQWKFDVREIQQSLWNNADIRIPVPHFFEPGVERQQLTMRSSFRDLHVDYHFFYHNFSREFDMTPCAQRIVLVCVKLATLNIATLPIRYRVLETLPAMLR